MERQVKEFLFRNLGPPEQTWCWGQVQKKCGLRTVVYWVLKSPKLQMKFGEQDLSLPKLVLPEQDLVKLIALCCLPLACGPLR